MAIAAMNVKIVSRGTGKSAVAGAAYRAAEKIEDERTGKTYDYTRKGDVVYKEILAPAHAPEWVYARDMLWNGVEKIEKRIDAELAREFMLPLPKELSQEQNVALAREYAQSLAQEGMVADLCIHYKREKDGICQNPHAHIYATMRPFKEDGTWDAKSHMVYILDEQGEKIRLASGKYKSHKVTTTDWDTKEKFKEWRERFETLTNDHLKMAGRDERISCKSYAEQGIDKTSMVHMGHFAHALEQQGIETKVGTINRHIRAENQQREILKQQLEVTLSAIEQEQQRQDVMRKKVKRTGTDDVSPHSAVPPMRTIGYEEMYKIYETSKKEALKKLQEEAPTKQRDLSSYEQKFVRGGRGLQRPARFGPYHRHRMKHPNWTKFAEGLRAKQHRLYEAPKTVDWAQVAKELEEKRVNWKDIAEKRERDFEDLYKRPPQRRQGPDHDRERSHDHDR